MIRGRSPFLFKVKSNLHGYKARTTNLVNLFPILRRKSVLFFKVKGQGKICMGNFIDALFFVSVYPPG